MSETLTREIEILNERGLHGRAAGMIMQLCETYQCRIEICFDGERADARSIMDLLTLAATQGSKITVEAEGTDAPQLIDAIEALIANRFGEER